MSTPGPSFRTRTLLLALTASVTLITGCSDTTRDNTGQAAAADASALANWRQPLFEGLGDVTLPISTTSTAARNYFNQGLALAYAFNHAAADFAFTEATVYDPECAMCYWLSLIHI